MKDELQDKIDLMAKNSKTVRKSAKLDFDQAANLGALLFTAENTQACEDVIRKNRKLLKKQTGMFNNMRGPAANLALLARMSTAEDEEAYIKKVKAAYEAITANKILKDETLVFTAMNMVDDLDPSEYAAAAKEAWATLDKMKEVHPMLTKQSDLTLAYLFNNANLDIDALLQEAERVYANLKDTGFKFNKDALQSISIILALSDKPTEEKCAKFAQLRNRLYETGHRIKGRELAVLAAFVDVDKSVEEIAQDIADVDSALKRVKGYGGFLCGANLRRLYAAALVLQAYAKEGATSNAAVGTAVSENIASIIILEIILVIVVSAVIATSVAASSN